MKRWGMGSLVALGILFSNSLLAQCSICTKTAGQLGEGPAASLNSAIIYLALAPFAIVGYFGWRWWKNEKEVIEDERSGNTVIKIVSGYSGVGGSTIVLINLTNMFNERGVKTIFYGPQTFHLNKCKSALLKKLRLFPNDILLTHYYKLPERPNVKNVVFACHEKWWFEIADIPQYWDTAVFLHEEQRNYHNRYKGPYTIIPNPKEPLTAINKPELDLVAGVIGNIDERKQTHQSIERALADSCEKVLIYGKVIQSSYFKKYVKHHLSNPKVTLVGFTNAKQAMYDSIGRVYHSSSGEVACLVKDECELTNTKFFGCDETLNETSSLTNDEIFDKWKKVLNF